jgi:hypothetical protein
VLVTWCWAAVGPTKSRSSASPHWRWVLTRTCAKCCFTAQIRQPPRLTVTTIRLPTPAHPLRRFKRIRGLRVGLLFSLICVIEE